MGKNFQCKRNIVQSESNSDTSGDPSHSGPKPRRRYGTPNRNRKEKETKVITSHAHEKRATSLLKEVHVVEGEANPNVQQPQSSVDKVKQWFDSLGIPCQPKRVPIPAPTPMIPKKNGKRTATTVESRIARRSRNHFYSASSVNKEVMIKYAGWIFDSIEKGSKNEEHGAKTYGPDYQWDGKIHMNDLTQRPQSSDTLTDEVDHLIRNNLRREKSLLKPGDVDGIKLRIPMDWAEMKEQEKPPFYQVPARYNQLRSLFVKHESESSSDGEGPSNSAKKGASTAVSKMSPRKGPAAPSSHQIFTEENNNEIRLLCQKFVLGGRSVNSDKKCAADLKREIAKLNAPHENYNLKTELVGAIDHRPTLFQYIEYLERTDIKSQELSSRSGDATLNENSSYEFRKEAYIFRRFIIDRGYSIDNITELTVERLIGSLLKGLIAADNVTDHDNASMSFPVHMLAMASGLRPDKYVRASKNYLNWDKGLLPVVFAEECKPRKNLNEDTCAQLAASLHPSLVILVLYYLDTRTSLMSPLPPWLFLYGIVYTEKGVIIWAHYPTIKHDTTNQTSAWKFRSSLITRKYEDAFDDTTNAGSRIQLLAALLKIRSHSLYVLEQLKVWEGRGRLILNGLLPQIQ